MMVAKTERAVTDSWITTTVKSEILANSITKGFDVSVKTPHGVVVLGGTLANQDAIDHGKDIAGKVTSVKSVDTSAVVIASQSYRLEYQFWTLFASDLATLGKIKTNSILVFLSEIVFFDKISP